MSNKVFVGGISWNSSESSLEQVFNEFGEVSSVKIITDRETGRSRGFGFIEYTTEEAANLAVEKLDGVEIDGRSVKVNIAQERAPRNDRSSGGGRW